jgi:DNA (cytosine-5)-methyltransferase 1
MPSTAARSRSARTLGTTPPLASSRALRRRDCHFNPVDPSTVNVYGRPQTGLRFIDFFAGAGGLSISGQAAGMQPVLAANHNTRAIETHGSNYPEVEHLMGDLSVLDPTMLPKGFADVLLCAPECVFHSQARNYREAVRELAPWDPKRAAERSRCTAWCSQRWAAYHRFLFCFHENVVDWARWSQMGNWVKGWHELGYRVRALSLNAAFFGAPSSRDRLYIVAIRNDVPEPNLDFRPIGYCWDCCQNVYGVQAWKKAALERGRRHPLGPVGKYGPRNQYVYTCPNCAGDGPDGFAVISPYATPAAAGIDWSIEAQRIGDRKRPLSPKTMARIERGLIKLGYAPGLVPLDRLPAPGEKDTKSCRPMWMPYMTQTTREDVGLLLPPGVQVDLRGTNQPRTFDEPTSTIAAAGNHHGLLLASRTGSPMREVDDEPAHALTTARSGGLMHITPPDPRMIVQTAGNTYERPGSGYVRAWSVDQPHRTLQTDLLHGVAIPPIAEGQGFALANYGGPTGGHLRDVSQTPLGTLTTGGQAGLPQHGILRTPDEGKGANGALVGFYGRGANERNVNEPAGSVMPRSHHGLLEPPSAFLARAGGTRQADVARIDQPAPTQMPRDGYGVVRPAFEIEDCSFRMVQPRECQVIMRLERRGDGAPYVIHGNGDEQVKQIGNAVVPTKGATIMAPIVQAICGQVERGMLAAA